MQQRPLLHTVVHAHVLAAGLLLTFAVCRLDPVRRRWGLPLRGTTLLAAGAAHAVLAKSLYAAPPPGTAFRTADLHTGSQVMYYGGDLVEAAIATVLATSWYQFTGRVQTQRRRRADAGRRPRAATGAAGGPGTAVRATDRYRGRAGTARHAYDGRQAEGQDVRFRERHEDGLAKGNGTAAGGTRQSPTPSVMRRQL